MVYKEILYSVENKHIALITINRAEAMNALTHVTHFELGEAIEQANNDDNVRVMIITGAGKGFCSGDDVKTIFKGGAGYEGEAEERRGRQLNWMQGGDLGGGGAKLLLINKPSIAAINGAAVGYGCDLALMCDIRVASEKAKLGEVFLRVGLIPDEGQILLPRLVGLSKAYELILTTDIIDAQEALRIGLVSKVVPHEELMKATMELATKIVNKPPLSVRLAKEGIRRGLDMPLREFKQWHSFAFSYCMESEDHKEGVKAFLEKREPVFKGR